jgi:hypothetical protein
VISISGGALIGIVTLSFAIGYAMHALIAWSRSRLP